MISCYIESYGCQMNSYDSDLVKEILQRSGARIVRRPEAADVILVNTCSVREHAETRVLGRVSELNRLKRRGNGRIIGVIGCMAQRLGEDLLRSAPYVDMVMGPGSYRKLPGTIELLMDRGTRLAVLDNGTAEAYDDLRTDTAGAAFVMVPVMRGCSEHCTYCIVPGVRGRARSRSPDRIVEEVREAATRGAREVTLLGQNITAYRHGDRELADVLRGVSAITGLLRLRFLTSHPKYLTGRTIDVMAERGVVCNHIHLPVQSGSDTILKRMGRGYTVRDYLRRIESLRAKVPGIAISTDLIAGFPGEGRREFEETLELMREVVFDDAFTYKYSTRPGTAAERLPDRVEPGEAQRRLEELIALQREHTAVRNAALTGSVVDVLVEKRARRSTDSYFGKTTCGRSVVFSVSSGTSCSAGEIVRISITGSTGPTLLGHIIELEETGG